MAYASASAAESAFYDAFSRGDHAAIMRVWAPSGDIVCVHPMGPRLIGFDAIAASWKLILAGESGRRFEIRTVTRWSEHDLAVHVVSELISVPGSRDQFSPVLATNVYQRIDDYWYLATHHASIDASDGLISAPSSEPQTRH